MLISKVETSTLHFEITVSILSSAEGTSLLMRSPTPKWEGGNSGPVWGKIVQILLLSPGGEIHRIPSLLSYVILLHL